MLEAAHPPLAGSSLKMIDRSSPLIKDLENELMKIEQELTTKDFKFGVLYCKRGQKHETDMFGNGTPPIHAHTFPRKCLRSLFSNPHSPPPFF